MAYARSTDSFLNAFYRMVNRRGLSREMLFDSGRNFIGGNKELNDLVKQLDQENIAPQTKASNGNLHLTYTSFWKCS